MSAAEYLKVNLLPFFSNFRTVKIELGGVSGVTGMDSGFRC